MLVPTTVSAGTNVKVLEAMAMQTRGRLHFLRLRRPGPHYTATASGSGDPEAFAAGVATLITDPERRHQIAEAAYLHAKRNFDWKAMETTRRSVLR